MNYKQLGRRIRAARHRKGLSLEQMAERCAFSTGHLSNIERNETKLSLEALVRISNVLDVSVDELLCDSLTRYQTGNVTRELVELEGISQRDQWILNKVLSIKDDI